MASNKEERQNKYWRDREEEALKHYLSDEVEYQRRIDEIYADMLEGCQSEIDRFYRKYAKDEGISLTEAKKRVSRLDIAAYERKAAKYVTDAEHDRRVDGKTNLRGYYFSSTANAEMKLYNATMKINRLEMLKANIGLELIKGTAELETFMEEILQGRTEEELARQAGILGDTIHDNAKLAHSIVNASFHNATFSERLWNQQTQIKADLSVLLQRGLIQGKGNRELARELQKYFIGEPRMKNGKKGAKYRAETLMRTELARVQTAAQEASFKKMGFEDYTFHANSGCCGDCQDLNGKHFKLDKMAIGENAPPIHPRCRCSVSAYSDRKEYDEWLDFLSKGGTTDEYNKLKAAEKAQKAQKAKTAKLSPAKARQQAEEYARSKGVKYVDYSKLPPETANLLNKALDTLPVDVRPLFMGDSQSLEKLWGGKLPRKSKQFYGVTLQCFNGVRGDFDAFGYMVGISSSYKTADAIVASKKETNARYQQRHNGHSWFFNISGETTPYHEMGHVYAYEKGLPDEFEFAATKWAIDTKCDMLTDPDEAWAEAWAAYHTGKNELPDYIRKYIEDAANK